MNWKRVLMVLFHAALQFGAAYGAARAAGSDNKTGLAAGGAAIATGQTALFSKQPNRVK